MVLGHELDRPRSAFAGFQAYRVAGAAVLVSPYVRSGLRDAAAREDPAETGGVLVGRVLCDGEGEYRLVTAALFAPPGTGPLRPSLTQRLREEAAARFPSCKALGWWHSQLIPAGADRAAGEYRRLWGERGHVGVLVYPRAPERDWARLYLSP